MCEGLGGGGEAAGGLGGFFEAVGAAGAFVGVGGDGGVGAAGCGEFGGQSGELLGEVAEVGVAGGQACRGGAVLLGAGRVLAVECAEFFLAGVLVGGAVLGVGHLSGERGVLGLEVGQGGVAGFTGGGGSLFAELVQYGCGGFLVALAFSWRASAFCSSWRVGCPSWAAAGAGWVQDPQTGQGVASVRVAASSAAMPSVRRRRMVR